MCAKAPSSDSVELLSVTHTHTGDQQRQEAKGTRQLENQSNAGRLVPRSAGREIQSLFMREKKRGCHSCALLDVSSHFVTIVCAVQRNAWHLLQCCGLAMLLFIP